MTPSSPTSDERVLYSAESDPRKLPDDHSCGGFATEVKSGLTLEAGAQQLLNFTLKVGSVAEQVVVSTAPPDVQLSSATIGNTVSQRAAQELPPIAVEDLRSKLDVKCVPARVELAGSHVYARMSLLRLILAQPMQFHKSVSPAELPAMFSLAPGTF